jgi:hypothetical protein
MWNEIRHIWKQNKMPLTKSQKRYLFDQSAVAAVMNFVMNGLMAWLIFRPAETVPVLGGSWFRR